MAEKLEVRLGTNISNFERGLASASGKLQQFSKKSEAVGKKLTSSGLALSATLTAGLAVMAGLAIKNYDKQAQAIAQVNIGLKSTGNLVGFTSEKLQKMASDLQTTSLFGDEDILKDVTAQLLTFTNIAGEQFARTQQAALDLATRLGGDLKGASIQLGKALNDPVANLSALSRSGIQFSEEQKNVINALVKTNRLADAQTIILDELEKQYGGSAAAAAEAGAGPMKQLAMAIGDLTEGFGKIMVDGLNPFIKKIKGVVEGMQNLSPATKKIIVVVGLLLGSLGPVLIALGFLMTTVIPGLITVFAFLSTTAIPAVIAKMTALNAVMIANPFILVGAAIAGLTYWVVSAVQNITPLVSKMKTFFNLLKNVGNYPGFVADQMRDQNEAMIESAAATKKAALALTNKNREDALQIQNVERLVKLLAKPIKTAGGGGGGGTANKSLVTGLKTTLAEITPLTTAINKTLAATMPTLSPQVAQYQSDLQMMKLALEDFNAGAKDIIENGIASTFSRLGDAIGSAMNNGGDILSASIKAIMGGLSGLLSAMGDYLIKAGTAAILAGTITKLFGSIAGIGAGLAAIAGGTLLKALAGGMKDFGGAGASSGAGSGGGGDYSGSSAGSGSSSFSGGSASSSGGGGGGTYVFELYGTKLGGVLKNTLDANKALGGSLSLT